MRTKIDVDSTCGATIARQLVRAAGPRPKWRRHRPRCNTASAPVGANELVACERTMYATNSRCRRRCIAPSAAVRTSRAAGLRHKRQSVRAEPSAGLRRTITSTVLRPKNFTLPAAMIRPSGDAAQPEELMMSSEAIRSLCKPVVPALRHGRYVVRHWIKINNDNNDNEQMWNVYTFRSWTLCYCAHARLNETNLKDTEGGL